MEPTLSVSIPVVIFALIGLFLYFASDKPKLQEVGRIMFMVAFFFFCAAFSGAKMLRIP